MSLAKFQGIVIALMVIGILVGASVLVLATFRDQLGDEACTGTNYWNTTSQVCQGNETNQTAAASNPTSYNGTNYWLTSSTNLSSKAPTAGTLFGIGLIIFAVFGGIFAFMRGGRV